MKSITTIGLTLISITEIIVNKEMSGSIFLWCLYGVYKISQGLEFKG